ncbi:hypothetical protein F2Q69_00052403 [Brassica cretica]|uniref:Uncharacterized protein n=1 Tax=Brassica cretica TaxID=69181 RepID=A0A8S9MMG0_BRACR|nr:hypothetical protein F2Q69_00052403 [Brassica cretica]
MILASNPQSSDHAGVGAPRERRTSPERASVADRRACQLKTMDPGEEQKADEKKGREGTSGIGTRADAPPDAGVETETRLRSRERVWGKRERELF